MQKTPPTGVVDGVSDTWPVSQLEVLPVPGLQFAGAKLPLTEKS